MARALRRVLVRAHQAKMLDPDTLVILGGDLNSRTIMPCGLDVLTETLKDKKFCQAILYKILAKGNWIDLTSACGTQHWITYKYHTNYQ